MTLPKLQKDSYYREKCVGVQFPGVGVQTLASVHSLRVDKPTLNNPITKRQQFSLNPELRRDSFPRKPIHVIRSL